MGGQTIGLSPWIRRLIVIGAAIIPSLFMGLMIATAGGAIFPSILKVSAPFACPDGQMEIVSQQYSYKPGQSGVARDAYCVNKSDGTSSKVTISVVVYSFLIYSSLLVVPLLMFFYYIIRRNKRKKG